MVAMLYYTGLFLLVIAVSLDGLGVGISYGIQKTRIPLLPIAIIMCCSGFMVFISMTIGDALKRFINPGLSENLGALILIGIGCFTLAKLVQANNDQSTEPETSTVITDVKKVFRSPQKADLDHSGTISKQEAILLGMALALDAFGAGFAASLLHYSVMLTAVLVATMSGMFLFIGLKLGYFLSKKGEKKFLSFFPSLLLIGIGFFNLIS